MSVSKIVELEKLYQNKDVNESISLISTLLHEYTVHSVRTDMVVTSDYRLDRVRVWYGLDNKIISIIQG